MAVNEFASMFPNQFPFNYVISLVIINLDLYQFDDSRITSYSQVQASIYGLANSSKQGQFIMCNKNKKIIVDTNCTRNPIKL